MPISAKKLPITIAEHQNHGLDNGLCTKILKKITDVLGKETKKEHNTPLFYIYDDGTVEKKISIE